MMKVITTLIFLFVINIANASPLSDNEEVIFFPTSASTTEQGRWKLPIHHWVYESEENTIPYQLGRTIVTEILELAGLSDEDTASKNFKERIKWFLVDNKGSKDVSMQLSNLTLGEGAFLHSTASNGHAETNIFLPIKKELHPRRWVKIEVDGFRPNHHKFYGEVQLIPAKGLSVISDIDDTIKISEVLDKKKLLKNVFVRPYQATNGMSKLYQRLEKKGAYFHYVSSSPWQLYPSLKAFMDRYYPKGTMTLRYFRLKDGSFLKFLKSSPDYKIEKITAIIKRYPLHQFILIGDSGEHDPKIYAKIYQRFPKNIQSIWIRHVKGSDISPQRLDISFKNVPHSIWGVFNSPQKLMNQ